MYGLPSIAKTFFIVISIFFLTILRKSKGQFCKSTTKDFNNDKRFRWGKFWNFASINPSVNSLP